MARVLQEPHPVISAITGHEDLARTGIFNGTTAKKSRYSLSIVGLRNEQLKSLQGTVNGKTLTGREYLAAQIQHILDSRWRSAPNADSLSKIFNVQVREHDVEIAVNPSAIETAIDAHRTAGHNLRAFLKPGNEHGFEQDLRNAAEKQPALADLLKGTSVEKTMDAETQVLKISRIKTAAIKNAGGASAVEEKIKKIFTDAYGGHNPFQVYVARNRLVVRLAPSSVDRWTTSMRSQTKGQRIRTGVMADIEKLNRDFYELLNLHPKV
ncbi:MAG: hypothetical protein V1817_03710 [Candidatus Micrarchaeota archaeon]